MASNHLPLPAGRASKPPAPAARVFLTVLVLLKQAAHGGISGCVSHPCPGRGFPTEERSTQTKLTAPKFARRRPLQAQAPSPPAPTAKAFPSPPPRWGSPVTSPSRTLAAALPLRAALTGSLCSAQTPISTKAGGIQQLGDFCRIWLKLAYQCEDCWREEGGKADRQRDCIRLVSIGNQAKRPVSV